LGTQDFLLRLTSPYNGGIKGVPKPVREEARRLLRHYLHRLLCKLPLLVRETHPITVRCALPC